MLKNLSYDEVGGLTGRKLIARTTGLFFGRSRSNKSMCRLSTRRYIALIGSAILTDF